jgi:hypothetical protein
MARVTVTVAIVLATALTGCGAPATDVVDGAAAVSASPSASTRTPAAATESDPADRSSLEAALAAFADFPESADPRPIVALDRVFGASGFRSVGAKEAFGSGNWDPPATMPPAPASYGGYPVITPGEALDRLRAETAGAEPQGEPLTVSDLRLATTEVRTDRGIMRLPAWRVLFEYSTGPNWVLAVAPSRLWERGIPPYFGWQWDAQTVADQRDLRVTVPSVYDSGFGGGPCLADYMLAVAESDHAVAVRAVAKPGVEPRSRVDCRDPLRFSVTLAAPLGGRVLLGVSGRDAAQRGPIPAVVSPRRETTRTTDPR